MRVLVDHSAAFNQGAGIGRYARNIVPEAARALPDDHFCLVYAPETGGDAPFHEATLGAFAGRDQLSVRRLPLSRRRADQLWFRARLPLPAQVFCGRVDVAYSPDFTVPFVGRTARVVTIHDLAFELRPEFTPGPLRRYLSSVVPRQVHGAAQVIAVSETTRQDVIERYGIDAERVTVVPNGVDERFFAARPLGEDERNQLGLPRDYLLMVGTLEPRKNHLHAFRAMRLLQGRVDLPLVVAGRRGWAEEPILEAARPLVADGRVHLLAYVPDDLLPGLYAGAAAVVYPSWYEGFGLPVAEALAAGAPVVSSTAPALRETGGQVALYADAARPESIAEKIELALGAEQRSAAARAGRQSWAARFRWPVSGALLADVLSAVGGGRSEGMNR